ncbi:hypothetical protein BCE02nite_49750 [Brevibacillus centrosporus]|nr:hypothetical protein BCE02nite_49750 [Brevibacillus centrosporus]
MIQLDFREFQETDGNDSIQIDRVGDATHTKARYNQKSPREILLDRSRKLRKAVYKVNESLKAKFPAKNTSGVLEDEIGYCQKLIAVLEAEGGICQLPKIKEPLNLLKETISDDLEQLRISEDQDARVGHKSADSAFFGYKTHMAMTEERIITAAVGRRAKRMTASSCRR